MVEWAWLVFPDFFLGNLATMHNPAGEFCKLVLYAVVDPGFSKRGGGGGGGIKLWMLVVFKNIITKPQDGGGQK